MKLYCEAQFFKKTLQTNEAFTIEQKELFFKKVIDRKKRKYSFYPIDVKYNCDFYKSKKFDKNKPTIIIPIKDNLKLLEYTLGNIRINNIQKYCNIFVVDDRSKEKIQPTVEKEGHNYLRVENEKGFNFSMLNNIAAKICHQLGNDTVILWNSDLWAADESMFLELLERHKNNNSKVSGSKLVYPPKEKSFSKSGDSENIKTYFPNYLGEKWRNTVQFGGDTWFYNPKSTIIHSPGHFRRFEQINNPMVNCDRGSIFVTGALHVWDLEYFINIGGLNPSLSKVFQDVDICLRAVESGDYPMYFGKDVYFYHDESLSLSSEKVKDPQFISDHYLFGKLWNQKLAKLISYGVS